MTQPPDPLPPPEDPPPPAPLSYATPMPRTSKNRWWMITLRLFGGMAAAAVSMGMGAFLSGLTNIGFLFLLPPAIVFTAFVVFTVKYRRFGYLSGFILAPFLAFVAVVIFLAILGAQYSAKP